MKSYTQWRDQLIDDLNMATLVEEPWSIEFVDKEGILRRMGNNRVEMKKKKGIWICGLDRAEEGFPLIRNHVEYAQQILKVHRICAYRKGTQPLPKKYEHVFRIDSFLDETGEQVVLLDREDNIVEMMQWKEGIDFVERFDLPVHVLGLEGRFATTQFVMLEDGLITTISERVSEHSLKFQ